MAQGQTFPVPDPASLQRDMVSLANWRQSPYNRFSFHHVREFIPTADVLSEHRPVAFTPNLIDAVWLAGELNERDLSQTLEASSTDAFVVVRQNELIFEWRADHYKAHSHTFFFPSANL